MVVVVVVVVVALLLCWVVLLHAKLSNWLLGFRVVDLKTK